MRQVSCKGAQAFQTGPAAAQNHHCDGAGEWWERSALSHYWLLKIFFCPNSAPQLVLFGLSNQIVVTFKEENTAAFKHLFLKGYKDNSPQAVHTQQEMYDHIQFAIDQVFLWKLWLIALIAGPITYIYRLCAVCIMYICICIFKIFSKPFDSDLSTSYAGSITKKKKP